MLRELHIHDDAGFCVRVGHEGVFLGEDQFSAACMVFARLPPRKELFVVRRKKPLEQLDGDVPFRRLLLLPLRQRVVRRVRDRREADEPGVVERDAILGEESLKYNVMH